MNIRAPNNKSLSAHWLMKFCSKLMESWQGYYQDVDDLCCVYHVPGGGVNSISISV